MVWFRLFLYVGRVFDWVVLGVVVVVVAMGGVVVFYLPPNGGARESVLYFLLRFSETHQRYASSLYRNN